MFPFFSFNSRFLDPNVKSKRSFIILEPAVCDAKGKGSEGRRHPTITLHSVVHGSVRIECQEENSTWW